MGEEPTPEQRAHARGIAREWMVVALWRERILAGAQETERLTGADADEAAKAAVEHGEETVTHAFQMSDDDRLLGELPQITRLLVEEELARLWKLVGIPWSDERPPSHDAPA